MKKSATDLMQEILFSAVIDALDAMKARSKGVPNTLLRDLNALHANTAFADLPAELQAAIGGSVRGAFAKLLKEGYSVSPGQPAPQRPQRTDGPPQQDRRERRPPPRHGDAPGPRGPRRGPGGPGGPRPGGGGGPRGSGGGGGRGGPGGGRGGAK